MRISKNNKTTEVKASKSDVGARTADFMRNQLMEAGYTKDEVNSMGLPELKKACEENDIQCRFNDVDACGDVKASTVNTDAIKYIKAAIDVLGKSGNKDSVTKDSIANLATVMFDLKSSNKGDK